MWRFVNRGSLLGCITFLFLLGCEGMNDVDGNDIEDGGLEARATTGHTSNNLVPDGQLTINQYLQSSDGSHRLYLQSDGNLVLRRMSDQKALWSSGTSGKSVTRFKFQSDGNLVLYTASNTAVWSSDTAGSGATKLHLHSAGNLVLYKNSTEVWSANGSPPPDTAKTNVSFPVRAAFYYPWFPETWTVNGRHVFYHPTLGYYRSDDVNVIDKHIKMMDYAKIEVAIVSWWGPDSTNEPRIPKLLERTIALGSPLKWAFYYEDEMFSNPSSTTISNDLNYLKNKYGNSPALARINGKPVMFVYNEGGCLIVDRWSKTSWGNWYVSMKVFQGYDNCSKQPTIWHQYGPNVPSSRHSGNGFSVSPGFWRADKSAPSLKRDVNRFYQNVKDMVASREPWQLITTFNEWGEGTAVEPASEWKSSSGYGQYLDALHTDGVK